LLDKKNISLLGLILGIIVFLFFNIASPPEGLDKISWLTAGVAILMTIWWVTEAIPIYATGLVPLLLFPLLDLFDLKVIIPRYSLPSPLNKISSADSFNLRTFFNLTICLEEGVIISLVDRF